MKLREFETSFKTRALCAEAFGVTAQQITTWIHKNRDVLQLADGRWIMLNKYSIISSQTLELQ